MLLTGEVSFKNINFIFILENGILKLISDKEKREEIRLEWFAKKLGKGAYSFPGEPIYLRDDYLIGFCNEHNKNIFFIPDKTSRLSENNGIILMKINSYFLSHSSTPKINRMEINSKEIDYIHPINNSFEFSNNVDEEHRGIVNLKTRDFDSTTTKKQSFHVDGKEVQVSFGISRIVNFSIDTPPLVLKSAMIFNFEETEDYFFISRLERIAKEFMQFLCFRKNIKINTVSLYGKDTGKIGNYYNVIERSVLDEPETLKDNRYISQFFISGHEGEILEEISNNRLYLRHISESFERGLTIDESSFILIMAAFEWEFRKLFPDGVPKSKDRLEVEHKANEAIDKLIQNSNGKLKGIFKRIKKSAISIISLSQKLEYTFTTLKDVLDEFGDNLYKLNNETFILKDTCKRLAKQRNNFAHGNLDKEFIDNALLDVIFMRFVIYAMQLKRCGVDQTNIRKSIGQLFRQRISI